MPGKERNELMNRSLNSNLKRTALAMTLLVSWIAGSLALSSGNIPGAHADYLFPPSISASPPYPMSLGEDVSGSHFTPGGTVDVWLVVYGGASAGYTQTVATSSNCSGRSNYCFMGGTISTYLYPNLSLCQQDMWAIAYDESTQTWSNEPYLGWCNPMDF
jgi:hypothetical protein